MQLQQETSKYFTRAQELYSQLQQHQQQQRQKRQQSEEERKNNEGR